MIEVHESNEKKDVIRIKQKDFKLHHLIVIQGKINEELTKIINKQGKSFKTSINFYL